MKLKKALCVAMVSAFLGGFVSVVLADDSKDTQDYIKERTYVGGFGSSTTVDNNGDFNGTHLAVGSSEWDMIPAIDRNFGFGGLVGHREGPYAAEVSYWRTSHTATWGGVAFFPVTAQGPASFQSLNIDFKRYLFTQLPSQPFFSLGLSFPWIVLPQGSTDGKNRYTDMTVAGIGFNLGIGVEIYAGSDFSIVGGAVQRWAGFNQIDGALKRPVQIVNSITGENISYEGDGLNFYVGGTIGFE